MRIREKMLCACISCGLCAALAVARPGLAGVNWDGGGADDNINTAANWDANTLPALTGASASLFFRGTTRLTPQLNIPINPLGIQFDSTAGSFFIGGTNTLTIGGTTTSNGNITNIGSATQTIDAPLIVNRGTLDAAAGDLVVNGTINVGGNSRQSGRSLTVTGQQQVILNGVIEGIGTGDSGVSPGGVINKNGAGILHIISNSPLWAGRIGINTGIVRIYAPDALGDPTSRTLIDTAAGTTTRLELAGDVTFAPERLEIEGRTSGTAPVHLQNQSGNNNWTGNVLLLQGGNEYGFEAAAGELIISGNIINERDNASAHIVRFAGAADAAFTGLFQNGSGTGPLTVRKDGIGSWTFTNSAVSYAGDTRVFGGTLAFSSGISINSSPNIQVSPGAILDLSSGSLNRSAGQTLVGGGTILGNVTNLGTITPDVPGTTSSPATLSFANNLALNGGGTITFDVANDTTVGGGVNDLIDVAGNLSLSGTTSIVIHPLTGVISNGTYRLFNYGGTLSGSAANLQLTFGPTRQTAAINTATANQVNLVVSGAAANLVWAGDGGANSWDVNTTTNWRNGATPDKFFNLDNVTFDDTAGAGNANIDIAETVSPGAVTVNSALNYTFTGAGKISGVTGITKSGTGTLTLDADNDNSGTITINAGTLQVGAGLNTGSLGTSNVVNNGALVFDRTTAVTVPGAISGNGTLAQHGTGTVILSGTNTYTGTTTVSTGKLQIGDGTTGSIGTGNVINHGLLIIDRASDIVFPNLVSGTGGLDKQGDGMVELAGLNTYTGVTTINGNSSGPRGGAIIDNLANGGVASDVGQSTSNAANLHIRTFGTLRYVGTGVTTDRLFTIGNARIEAAGTGPLVFENPGSIGTSGGNRTLTLLGANTGHNTLAAAIVDSGPSGVTTLTKTGDGTWVLSGNSTFSGLTTVSAGTLIVASPSALGARVPLPGNTNSAGTSITGDTGGTGRLGLSGGITVAAEPINLFARQGPTATIAHLLNVSGDNHWTGPISLVAGGSEYNFQSDADTLFIDSNITQTLVTLEKFVNLQGAGNGVVNGAIVNGGGSQVQSLRKRGNGTWTLNGVNTYRGTTHVQAGTLTIGSTGAIAPESLINTSAGATFRVEGSATVSRIIGTGSTHVATNGRVTLAPDGDTSVFGDLQIPEVGPLAPGTLDVNDNDIVVQSSEANKAADLARLRHLVSTGFNVGDWLGRGITSSTAAANTEFTTGIVMVDNAVFGFPEFSGQPVTADSILFKYTYYGDIDANGRIDADDLTVFANNFGLATGATQIDGNIDFDGDVDADDLTVFANNFGRGIGNPLAAGVAAVPEPSSLCLAGLGAVGVLTACFPCRRRSARSRALN